MLNWLTRYACVAAELELDGDGALCESVLDVGCGPHGLSIVAPRARFAGIDVAFGGPVATGMVALRARPGPLPFADASFDTVVCLDVLEHVPPADRAGFVVELARVAARRVLLACPSEEGAWVERALRGVYDAAGTAIPEWLSEHDEHGLPRAEEIAAWSAAVVGFSAHPIAMPNGLLSGLLVLGDMSPDTAGPAATEWLEHRADWLALLQAARFGDCYRKGWVLEREAPARAAIGADDLAHGIWSAVRCPACAGATLTADRERVGCSGCGHTVARDARGAWDLAAADPRSTPAATRAGRQGGPAVVFRPGSWRRPLDWLPVLSAFVAHATTDGAMTLCLDGRHGDLDPPLVRSLLALACELLAGDEPFAPVVLLEGTVDDPSDAVAIVDERDLLQRLGAPPARHDATAAAIVAHARWAKTIADAVQALLDRALLEASPPTSNDSDPLVTVRIPTFGSVEELVGRAIPSALAGAYRNIEVLVCSDGPQPHARAAVASVADPRVRYIELDERPAYPSWPESFWRTAGTHAVNRLLDEARGAFIAPLDHDDGLTNDHIPALIDALRREQADFVYGRTMAEWPGGDWRLHGEWPIVYGEINHSAVLYSGRLAHMRYDPDAWLLGQPGDWNLWCRMRDAGAVMCHLHEPVAVHFKERSSIDHAVSREAIDEDLAADVLGTSARELLRVARRG